MKNKVAARRFQVGLTCRDKRILHEAAHLTGRNSMSDCFRGMVMRLSMINDSDINDSVVHGCREMAKARGVASRLAAEGKYNPYAEALLEPVNKWTTKLYQDDLVRLQEICERFGLTRIGEAARLAVRASLILE